MQSFFKRVKRRYKPQWSFYLSSCLVLLLALAGGCKPIMFNKPDPVKEPVVDKNVDFQKIIATAKSRVYPALVFVKPVQETFEEGERQRTEVFGSGVIIDAAGYVVTNNHVADKAIEVNCVLGDKELVPAVVVGLDPETDLALLKLKLPENHPPLTVADFGNSNDVSEGQFVMALGAPFGFTRSISLGIISNTNRYLGFSSSHKYNVWFQTDATINPGNSGGPLVDTNGNIIGINTLGMSTGGIGFAIPSNVVRDIIGRLKAQAAEIPQDKWPVKVERAYSGIELQALNDFQTNTFTDSKYGVLIRSVDANSPAAEAGIKDGDVLLSVDGINLEGDYVEKLPQLLVFLSDLSTDQPAKFVIARKGMRTLPGKFLNNTAGEAITDADLGGRGLMLLSVKPIIRGKFEGEDCDLKKWNMTVKEISKFKNPRLHFLQPAGGVYVQGVRYSGNASEAGIITNDILLSIDNQPVKTVADVKAVYEKLVNDKDRTEKKTLIQLKRGVFERWVVIEWTKDFLKED